MNPDLSLYEIFVWNRTMQDPYSNESLARRFLSTGASIAHVAEILKLDLKLVKELYSIDQNDFIEFGERFKRIYKNMETIESKNRKRGIYNNIFSYAHINIHNDGGLTHVLGMTPSQLHLYREGFED